jgi:hypothetical protein
MRVTKDIKLKNALTVPGGIKQKNLFLIEDWAPAEEKAAVDPKSKKHKKNVKCDESVHSHQSEEERAMKNFNDLIKKKKEEEKIEKAKLRQL